MVAKGKNLPTEWGNDKNIKWTHDLNGVGWSSPIVWKNKVFISSVFLEKKAPATVQETPPALPTTNPVKPPVAGQNPPPPPPKEDNSYLNDVYRWEVSCVDLNSGKELWKKVALKGNPRIKAHNGNTYASETPVTDGKRVYVYFGMTGLFCFDLDGKLLWQKDLGAYETQNGWGTGSSPVIYNDILYLQIDNEVNSFLVALDAATGEQKWKADRNEKTNYSTPIIWKNKIRTELVTTGKIARSYDLNTGKVLWEMKLAGGNSIASPVGENEHLYIGNSGGREEKGTLFSVKPGAEGDITPPEGKMVSRGVEWSVQDAGTGSPSPLLYNGLIYILGGRGEFNCFDAASGTLVYKNKIENVAACWASPWAYNEKIYFTDEKGVTQIVKAGKQFEVLSTNKLDDKFWSSIAITDDSYLFKGVARLYCIQK
jgi:outer membrane protein assembly factor BamB